MKKIIAILFSLSAFSLSALAQSPVYEYGYLAPGVPQTNPVVIEAWPPANKWIVFNGTNSVYVITTTNQPNASGYWSNSFYPTGYRKTIPALNAVMYFNVLNTTNPLSVAQLATNVVVAGNMMSNFQLMTNWLGYTPATNSFRAFTNILGFVPATNPPSLITTNFAVLVPGSRTNWLRFTNSVLQNVTTN